jgi:hypothetical protein
MIHILMHPKGVFRLMRLWCLCCDPVELGINPTECFGFVQPHLIVQFKNSEVIRPLYSNPDM